ncbi:MAG: PAS domain S-box protein [Chloroflexia bacterium]
MGTTDAMGRRFLWLIQSHVSRRDERGYAVVFSDITDRKLNEARILASEEQFRILADASFEGIVFIENGVVVHANSAFANMHGYEFDELVGKPALDLVEPESRALVTERIAANDDRKYELIGIRRDGSRFNVEALGRATTYKGRQARVTAIRDITDRKQNEARILESEEQFRILADASFEGVAFFEDGVVVHANSAFALMFGYELDAVVGLSVQDLVAPDSLDTVYERIRANDELPYEAVGIRSDGAASTWKYMERRRPTRAGPLA